VIDPSSITPTALPSVALAERATLPAQGGIYFALHSDTVLYVGQASTSFQQRWAVHHRLQQLTGYEGCRIAWLHVDDVSLLDDLEQACIDHLQPVLNGTDIPGRKKAQITVVFEDPRDVQLLAQIARRKRVPLPLLMRMWLMQYAEAEQQAYCEGLPCSRRAQIVWRFWRRDTRKERRP
jgi:hypothetical protein